VTRFGCSEFRLQAAGGEFGVPRLRGPGPPEGGTPNSRSGIIWSPSPCRTLRLRLARASPATHCGLWNADCGTRNPKSAIRNSCYQATIFRDSRSGQGCASASSSWGWSSSMWTGRNDELRMSNDEVEMPTAKPPIPGNTTGNGSTASSRSSFASSANVTATCPSREIPIPSVVCPLGMDILVENWRID